MGAVMNSALRCILFIVHSTGYRMIETPNRLVQCFTLMLLTAHICFFDGVFFDGMSSFFPYTSASAGHTNRNDLHLILLIP
ncbi:hypothetical protein GQ43DRAFT_312388 [Delitschia confertaspora ATCC 74209]|uniref:Uncharacterized protein n=1 Tax=Delitschia confertaspora ATCC 74209 TaxID=1513339 RepID=A0A9P4JSI5_9PLEO|nr:hypothetical protein GQ43DRAFT_312388 [Delitschia confertaspora ATCC 74209]